MIKTRTTLWNCTSLWWLAYLTNDNHLQTLLKNKMTKGIWGRWYAPSYSKYQVSCIMWAVFSCTDTEQPSWVTVARIIWEQLGIGLRGKLKKKMVGGTLLTELTIVLEEQKKNYFISCSEKLTKESRMDQKREWDPIARVSIKEVPSKLKPRWWRSHR